MGDRSKPCAPPLPKPCPCTPKESETREEQANEKVQDTKSPKRDSASTDERDTKQEAFIVPFDARFPNMNQTRRCWQNYVDYYRCLKQMGDDYTPCEYFKKIYTSLCPDFWIEQWDEQRENGTFAGKIE